MNGYGQMSRIRFKVRVRGEYRQSEALANGTNQKIHTASRHALGPTRVEKLRSLLVVDPENGNVVEVGESFPNALEVPLLANS